MTEFQQRILDVLPMFPNSTGSTWAIAQYAFPEKWAKRSGRGALVGHIARAAVKAGCHVWAGEGPYPPTWVASP